MWPGLPLGVLAAVYTAFLFAQAKARDLWQSPLLPLHMLVQALLAGSAALLVVTSWVGDAAVPVLARATMTMSVAQLVLAIAEATPGHRTAHARLAVYEMRSGRYAPFFRTGTFLVFAAVLAPWLGPIAGVAALAGLLAYDHAYVQAGQAVPLA